MTNKILVSILIVVGLLALVTVSGILLMQPETKVALNLEPTKETNNGYGSSKIRIDISPCQKIVFQGPVQPDTDESYFRQTGITRSK